MEEDCIVTILPAHGPSGSVLGSAKDISIRLGRGLGGLALEALARVLTWQERARQRRDLAALDERMLRDVGLDRGDIWRETQKRFWER